jgi:hypothetical protein
VDVPELLAEAGRFPADDYRRWKAIRGLTHADRKELLAQAQRLLTGEDADDRVLGAQILDPDLLEQDEEPGRAEVRAVEPLLLAALHPDQEPAVIVAAMGPYAILRPEDPRPFLDLLGHPDSAVRAEATWQMTFVNMEPAAPLGAAGGRNVLEILHERLEQDADREVRANAAQGLRFLYTSAEAFPGPSIAPTVHGYLAPHLADPVPEIRTTALYVAIDAEPDAVAAALTEELVTELRNPGVDWHFVDLARAVRVDPDEPEAEHLNAVLREREAAGWPAATGVPETYPDVEDRMEMLEQAILHTTAFVGE